ncbi:MAG: beta-galactosidase [Armatimonadota bacterium]|nr:beta-galactosidase [Armatimonadota bacterium]
MMVGPAYAQDTRIFIIRDDDGTADEGRGQVTSHHSVCRKTLILDREPADIQRAWVQYFMKVRPYDVETRKLYDGPVEGVTWSDLVIAVNGAEVLRDSLIEHGTMGWHEVEFDPGLLQRGENHATITVSAPGNYFYLGIDRENDYGRSASSRDQGETWREGWLSFNTDEPDAGEYMVRLKIEAPEPEQVGFVERGGEHYAWLEMEDLFSKTQRHPSGFKAIQWDRGANRPSSGWLAHNMKGRVSFPLGIPADRQWKLWMRAWADGFRNGSFTLSVDGQQVYDSTGHEFTSDANLRLDWLDMGVVHLGEGTHTFEIVTEGECGHMFDVFVLTTDIGLAPDVDEPLPRMTTVASLVAAPGITELEPGLYMTQSPIPWAKPLAGGPLRALWICGDINEREIVELQQRMDLEATAVSSPTNYLGNQIFGQDLSLDQADAIYERLLSEPPVDAIVLVRTKLDQLPEHVMEALLERVEEGTGLIVVRSRRDETPTPLDALLDETQPLDVSALASPLDLHSLDRASLREYGDGRIVVIPYSLWGTMHRLSPPAHTLRYRYWEYQFARWIDFLMTATGRDTAQIATVAAPDTVAPDEEPTVTLTLEGQAAQVRATWLPPFAEEPTALEPVPVAGGTASIALPGSAEDGLYHVALTLTDAAGAAVGIASAYYAVRRARRIADVAAECTEDGSALIATLTTEGPGELPVRAEVYGSHERLLGATQGSVGGGNDIRVPLIDSHERLVELRLTVPGEGGPAQRVEHLVPRPQEVVLDDYLPYSGLWGNRECPDYCLSAYARIWEDLGIRAIQPSGIIWHSLEQGYVTAQPYRLTSVGNGTVDAEGVRTPCLHDDEMWAEEEPKIRESVRSKRKFSPVLLGLGDEMSIGRDEACFSEHTRAAFREWLRDRYAGLDELNAFWDTAFATWEDVEPWRLEQAKQRPENIAPWLEFRKFMAHTFVGAVERMQRWAQEEAGDTHIGGVNPWDEGWTTCTVMSKLFPVLEYGQIYPRSHDVARSFFRDPRLIGTWSGYSRPQRQIEREGWLLPAYGGTFMGWYGVGRELGYETLTGTLNLGERAQWISGVNHELTSGVGKLLIETEAMQEPVAILHSWPSRCAYIAALSAEEHTPADALDQRWDQCEETFVRMLRDLAVPYTFVDEDQVAAGYLQERDVDCLIAPRAWALSEATLEKIRQFMAAGYAVICDSRIGIYDERGRRREAPPVGTRFNPETWDDLPAPMTEENLARLRELLAPFVAEFADQTLHGDFSFIVPRTFGEHLVLVVFGEGPLGMVPQGTGSYWNAREHRLAVQEGEMRLSMEHGPAVLVIAFEEIAGLGIEAEGAALGEAIRYDLSLASGNDTVAHVTVIGPDGEERAWYADNLRLSDGAASGSFTPALNDPSGRWIIRALDIITGESAEATVEIAG